MLKNTSILLVALVPAVLIVLIKVYPGKDQPVSDETVISESEARRIELEERRAEREEARKARRAIRQAQEKEQRSQSSSPGTRPSRRGAGRSQVLSIVTV